MIANRARFPVLIDYVPDHYDLEGRIDPASSCVSKATESVGETN
jgi:hypothetical protein